jgi:DNA polymerase-3 subunit gamma/tau
MPSYLVLARKYRPAGFDDVIGQSHVVQTLCNAIQSGRVAHAFLFCGVRGVGKTTVARILAKALNCTGREENDPNPCNKCRSCIEIRDGVSVDVQEIDGASNTSVENIREINENIKYPPAASKLKIIIIDEVHMISVNAFNALLKTLEEPPPHAKFMFATTESHKVPATIQSRCQRFNLRTISIPDIIAGMARILEQEGVTADEEALALVAREAQGSFRDALSLLDQVISFCSGVITEEDVVGILGIAGRGLLPKLMAAILSHDGATSLGIVQELFQEGYNPEQLALDMIEYVRNLTVLRALDPGPAPEGMVDAAPSELEEMAEISRRASVEELQNLFNMLLRSENEIKRAGNPWVALEMMILRMAHAPNIVDLAQIIRKIDSKDFSSVTAPPPQKKTAREPARVTAPPPPEIKPPKKAKTKKETTPSDPAEPAEKKAEDRFVIEEVTPVPTGTPDEIWTLIKERLNRTSTDPFFVSMMEHASLISVGRTVVEIGFNKGFYKTQFESRLAEKPEIRKIFQEFFGAAEIKTLTLAEETTLKTPKPYESGGDGNGDTDRNRALKQEALDNPIVQAVREAFEDSDIKEIKILT